MRTIRQRLGQIALYKIILTLFVVGFPFFAVAVGVVETGKFNPLILVVLGLIVLYFVPTIYALLANAPNFMIWFVLNVLGAWTGIGWVIIIMGVFLDLRNNVIRVPAAPARRR